MPPIELDSSYSYTYKCSEHSDVYARIKNYFIPNDSTFIFFSNLKLNHKSKKVKPSNYLNGSYVFNITFSFHGVWVIETYENGILMQSDLLEVA